MSIGWVIFLGMLYVVFGSIYGACVYEDNKTLPSFFDRPSPWLRGMFWFPVMFVAICLIALDMLGSLAGGAHKHRR